MSGRLARSYAGADPRRRAIGWALVILIHVAALWALVSGTARKGLEILKKPMEAAVIQEVIIPPPPPPPPKQIKPPEPQAPRTEAPPPPFVPARGGAACHRCARHCRHAHAAARAAGDCTPAAACSCSAARARSGAAATSPDPDRRDLPHPGSTGHAAARHSGGH